MTEVTKRALAESFGYSASRYDQFATIQQQAGQELLELMQPLVNDHFSSPIVADVGCGTGYFSQSLLKNCNAKKVIGVDISQGMLDFSLQKNKEEKRIEWLLGDAENLPFEDNSLDVIYANFSLQWCEDLEQLSHHFFRVLKKNGIVCFNSLGTQTLVELKNSWALVDDFHHVNQFSDEQQWRDAFNEKFSIVQYGESPRVEYFDSLRLLMQSLKAIGANTVTHPDRRKVPLGKKQWQQLTDAYEAYRTVKGLPVTYDINNWILRKVV